MTAADQLIALWQLGVAMVIGFALGCGLTFLVKIAVEWWYGRAQWKR